MSAAATKPTASKGTARNNKKRKAGKEVEDDRIPVADDETTKSIHITEPIASWLLDKKWMESNCQRIKSRTYNAGRKQTSEEWVNELEVNDEIRGFDEWRDQKVDFEKDLVTFKQFHDLFNGGNSRHCQKYVFYEESEMQGMKAVTAIVYKAKPMPRKISVMGSDYSYVGQTKDQEQPPQKKQKTSNGSAGADASAGNGAITKAPDYVVVVSETGAKLTQKVKDLIKSGWKPQGGINTVSTEGIVLRVYQAMVKGFD